MNATSDRHAATAEPILTSRPGHDKTVPAIEGSNTPGESAAAGAPLPLCEYPPRHTFVGGSASGTGRSLRDPGDSNAWK